MSISTFYAKFSGSLGGGGTGGVTSVNGIAGAVTLVAGSNITITPSGSNLTIASTSGGTVTNVTGSGNIASSGGTTPNITFTGVLPIANGGTNNGSLAVTAGGIVYTDGTKLINVGAGSSGQILQSNGASAPSWVAAPSAGANTTLSNLGTTSINANLLPNSTGGINIGSTTLAFGIVNASAIHIIDTSVNYPAGVLTGTKTDSGTLPSGDSTAIQLAANFAGASIAVNSSTGTTSGNVFIESGNATAGNSGNILLYTGTATGTRGSLKIQDGSEGTSGQVWTSTDTVGSGHWAAAAAILVFASTATVGGAASEAVTVTGLLSGDTILSVSQKTPGGAALPLLGWSTQITAGITVIYSADMGPGAVVLVAVKR